MPRTSVGLRVALCGMLGTIVLAAGCHSKVVDKAEFKSALNNYYSSRQVCLWPEPAKFPAQADTNNEDQTKGFDALTDAGLLTRTPAEKKRAHKSKLSARLTALPISACRRIRAAIPTGITGWP